MVRSQPRRATPLTTRPFRKTFPVLVGPRQPGWGAVRFGLFLDLHLNKVSRETTQWAGLGVPSSEPRPAAAPPACARTLPSAGARLPGASRWARAGHV